MVPITVRGSAAKAWISTDLTLEWNQAVLTFKAVDTQSPFSSGSLFNSGTAGSLGFSWFSGTGATVTDPATLFTVTFTAANNAASDPTTLGFLQTATREVAFLDTTWTTPDTISGVITVVPEPVNCALGLFACAWVSAAGFRWVSRRNHSMRTR